MFGGGSLEEEDADFLSPTGGARLASLFGTDQAAAAGGGKEFFQYTAPKQPRKGRPTAAAGPPAQKPPAPATHSAPPSVFIATAVHAYRFINGQYAKQGKYGAAVVGNHATREYRLLLYLSQQQQMSSAKIHSGFVFTVQPNNYCTFYDDQRQNWSIMFESEKAAVDFSRQVCLAKYNSHHSPDAVVSQDLLLGENQGVEVGDALEVVFTGWLFENAALGQVFDSNVSKSKWLRLRLGSGKIIKGWEEGMLGMRKGGRRLLIVPPALAYGSQGLPSHRVPPDSTVALEVELARVRLAKDSASNGQSQGSQDSPALSPAPENITTTDLAPAGVPPSTLAPKPGEVPLRAKSSSLSEQLTNPPGAAKAKLISRMAKMGQPMLPFLPGTAQAGLDSSDSEVEDPNSLHATVQPTPPSPLKPSAQALLPHMIAQVPQTVGSGLQLPTPSVMPPAVQAPPAVPGTVHSFQPYTGMTYAYPHTTAATSQLQPVATMYPSPFQGAGDLGSFLMTEARQQSTEIRLAVGKVTDKIDHLAAKMEELQKQNPGHSLLPGFSSVTMETPLIMSNIQRIVQENERLKQEVFEKNSRIEEQNEKIRELIARNQRYVEQSNLWMEERNHSLQANTEHKQARVLLAEQEKVKVAEELAAATAQASRLQLELAGHQKKEMDLRSQLNVALEEAEKHGAQIHRLQAQLAELQGSSEDSKSSYQAEKQSRKQLDGKVSTLEEKLADLRVEKENLEKNLSERKKKSLLDRKQAEEEMEEIRKSHQEELEKLRQLLQKSRTSTDLAASEQLNASGSLESEKVSALQEQLEQLEPFRDKVKKIMNGVFQSLRAQFELEKSYPGRAVLGTVMNTIKRVTLQLLERPGEKRSPEREEEEEEEEEEGGPAAPSREPKAPPAPVEPLGKEDPDGGGPPEEAPTQQRPPALEAQEEEEEEEEPLPLASGSLASSEPPLGLAEEEEEEEPRETAGPQQLEEADVQTANLSTAAAVPDPAKPVETALVLTGGSGPTAAPPALPDPLFGSGKGDSDDGAHPPPGSGPSHTDYPSSLENKGCLFKAAARKPHVSCGPREEEEEEEEEEELSLKGRPPPTPLFGDEEDEEEDLGWLS